MGKTRFVLRFIVYLTLFNPVYDLLHYNIPLNTHSTHPINTISTHSRTHTPTHSISHHSPAHPLTHLLHRFGHRKVNQRLHPCPQHSINTPYHHHIYTLSNTHTNSLHFPSFTRPPSDSPLKQVRTQKSQREITSLPSTQTSSKLPVAAVGVREDGVVTVGVCKPQLEGGWWE